MPPNPLPECEDDSTSKLDIVNLNPDVLLLIFGYLSFPQQLRVSSVCRFFRRILLPRLFESVLWAPGYFNGTFAPDTILPYIQRVVLTGEDMPPFIDEANALRVTDAPLLKRALPSMKLLRLFIIKSDMTGSVWPELFDAFHAAMVPFELVLQASWIADEQFKLPASMSPILLRAFAYLTPYVQDPAIRHECAMRRKPGHYELEQENLHRMLSACRQTLTSTYLPSELLFQGMDLSSPWLALRKLEIEGFWPEEHLHEPALEPVVAADSDGEEPTNAVPRNRARRQLLQLLEAMPALRTLSLLLAVHPHERNPLPIITDASSSHPESPQTFLRSLQQLTFGAISADEMFFHFLPLSVTKLDISLYPASSRLNVGRLELSLNEIGALLERADFPQLEAFGIWYRIRTVDDLDAEAKMMSSLSRLFPLIKELTVRRRWAHREPALKELWDPASRIRSCIAGLKHLRSLKFDPDMPQRFGKLPFPYQTDGYWWHVNRLYDMAKIIVEAAPWLDVILMYCDLGRKPELHWKAWKLVDGEDGVRRPGPPPKKPVEPEIR